MRPAIALLLLAWVTGIIIGILSGNLAALGIGLLGCLLFRWPGQRFAITVAASFVLLLGWVYGQSARPANSAGRPAHLNCSVERSLVVTVVARPDIREKNIRYLVADSRGCHFFVYADRWPVYEQGTVLTIHGGRYADQATVMVERPEFGRYLVQHNIAGVWSYPAVQVAAQSTADKRYRALVTRTHRVFIEPEASLVGAILLADRGQFPASVTEDFRRTSLTHILSVSGMHISLLTGLLFSVVGLLALPPPVRTALVIILLWTYVWFVGSPVSAIRAGWFWSVALVALRLGLLVSLPTAILITLVAMLSWRPLLAADISLQLSCMAVLGLGLGLFISKPWQPRGGKAVRALTSATAVSLGASLFTWPLISYYFGVVSLSAIAANLLILPTVPVIMVGSILVIGVSYVFPLLSYLVALPVHAATVWMVGVAQVLASWPGSWVAFTAPGWLVGLYYGALLLALGGVVRGQKRSWREVWE